MSGVKPLAGMTAFTSAFAANRDSTTAVRPAAIAAPKGVVRLVAIRGPVCGCKRGSGRGWKGNMMWGGREEREGWHDAVSNPGFEATRR